MEPRYKGPQPPRRVQRGRVRWAILLLCGFATLGLGWTTPAGAIAVASTPDAADVSATEPAGGLDLVTLAAVIGFAVIVGTPIACRDRIVRQRDVRQFRAQLRHADVVDDCRRRIAADDARVDGPEPPV